MIYEIAKHWINFKKHHKMNKKVDIILVNWNSGEKTVNAALPYLGYASQNICCNVIVVDNASTDNSLSILKARINNVIENDKNVGFGKACNQAFEGSTADYILLLNPDTQSDALVLENLVHFLEEHKDYGIIGPRQIDKRGEVLRTCARFPTFKTSVFDLLGLSKIFPTVFTPASIMIDWDHGQSMDVDQIMGSYMVIRKSILDEIGFMDDEYFMYHEDLDLSKRFNDAGFKTFYDSSNSIFHEGGGTGQKLKEYRLFYSLWSRQVYWRKYLGKFNCFLLVVISITVEPFLRVINSLFKEKTFEFKGIAKAYFMYLNKIIRN